MAILVRRLQPSEVSGVRKCHHLLLSGLVGSEEAVRCSKKALYQIGAEMLCPTHAGVVALCSAVGRGVL